MYRQTHFSSIYPQSIQVVARFSFITLHLSHLSQLPNLLVLCLLGVVRVVCDYMLYVLHYVLYQ